MGYGGVFKSKLKMVKKLLYYSPYVPIIGMVIVPILELYQSKTCIHENVHNLISSLVQSITVCILILSSIFIYKIG